MHNHMAGKAYDLGIKKLTNNKHKAYMIKISTLE